MSYINPGLRENSACRQNKENIKESVYRVSEDFSEFPRRTDIVG